MVPPDDPDEVQVLAVVGFWVSAVLALTQGVSIAAVLAAMDIGFVKSLIIAVVSSLLTGAFLIVSTVMTLRHTDKKTHRQLEDVKNAVGADKRATDSDA